MKKQSNQALLIALTALVYTVHVYLPKLAASHEIAPTKSFESLEEFYPFYYSQHLEPTCQQLHVLGTVILVVNFILDPAVLLSVILALATGFGVFPITRHLPDGRLEMAAMLTTFVLTMKFSGRSVRKALSLPVLFYACAWTGHFFFEHNKPATFIYPSHSLASDFRLAYEVVMNAAAGSLKAV